ncbi:MAG: LacI family DNA-binding transcriptional regulator [Sphingobacteriales bacterium]|nr:LacI family DNA-binding transcriptional regulator [Sphingobacteriales bacterium]
MKPTTIKDIAKALNINPSTVSRGLKRHTDISEDMIQRIHETAQLMNYLPNQLAAGFRNHHSKLIALILPDINMYYFPAVIKTITNQLKEQGYNLIMLHSNEDVEREKENVAICRVLNIEGVLACLTYDTEDHHHFDTLSRYGIPLVYFDKIPTQSVHQSVTFDDVSIAQRAIEYLIATQAKRIVAIMGNSNLSITQRRQMGCFKAINNKPEAPTLQFIYANNTQQAKEKLLQNLLNPFDSIFCMSDEILAGVMQAAHLLQWDIPNKVQIIAISDGDTPYYFQPNITFIKTSGQEIAQKACSELLKMIKEKNAQLNASTVLYADLIINGSTRAPLP